MAKEQSTSNAGQQQQQSPELDDSIQFIGDRNAILFSADAGEPLPPLELPDDFFELDKDDVRILYKELKENREVLESAPFRSKAVRELEENTATLRRLNRYTKTVLRVQFPDRLVLQAVFNHSDTVGTAMEFLQQFLDPPDVQFQLYTAPPKSVLSAEVTLVESKLTPRALVYFGAITSHEKTTFLKPSLLTCLTSPRLASEAALRYRRQDVEEEQTNEAVNVSDPSSSCPQPTLPSTSKKTGSGSTKVPKWFKR